MNRDNGGCTINHKAVGSAGGAGPDVIGAADGAEEFRFEI